MKELMTEIDFLLPPFKPKKKQKCQKWLESETCEKNPNKTFNTVPGATARENLQDFDGVFGFFGVNTLFIFISCA